MDRRRFPPPRVRDPRDVADELSERRSRALEEPLDLRLRQREPYPLVEVRNPLHGTAYLVMRPAYPAREPALCTCTDFARRDLGSCKHIEAVGRWLDRHLEDPVPAPSPDRPRPGAVWHEIDRRIERDRRSGSPLGRRWSDPGAALFETA